MRLRINIQSFREQVLAQGWLPLWPRGQASRQLSCNQTTTGYSLAEAVVALGVLGIVLIPILFFSSANFTHVLMTQREKLGVAHAGSQVLNRLALDLSQVRRLLPESDETRIYYAYYDPIREEVLKQGYMLADNEEETGKHLYRMIFNEATESWMSRRAYGRDPSEAYTLPLDAKFVYCAETDCSVAPENALSVKLVDWQFARSGEGTGYTLALPSDGDEGDDDEPGLHIYLSSGVTGEVFMSDIPRQLFAMFAGNDLDLSLMSLSPGSGNLNLPDVNPTPPAQDPVTLTTLLAAGAQADGVRPNPEGTYYLGQGFSSSAIDPATGRVFFAGANNFYMWENGTLSTLLAGVTQPGHESTAMIPSTGRVFFASNANPGNLYTWLNGTLSTVLTSRPFPRPVAVDPVREAVVLAENNTPGNIYYWRNGVLNTLGTNQAAPGQEGRIAISPVDGRVFWGESSEDAGHLYARLPGGALSTIMSDQRNPGSSMAVDPNTGRVFFASSHKDDAADNTNFHTWAGGTLSTLLSNRPALGATLVNPVNGRVFFGEGQMGGNYYTWHASTALSTLLTNRPNPGVESSAVDPATGRVFFGEKSDPGTGHFYTWFSGTLSTLVENRINPGLGAIAVDPATGRVFFGDQSGGSGTFYTWQNGVLSVLQSGVTNPGSYAMSVDPQTGRVFWGDDANLYAWSNGTLSTLVSGVTNPGFKSLRYDPSSDLLYYGVGNSMRALSVNRQTGILYRANAFGVPSSQYYPIQRLTDVYVASTQDIYGDLFLANSTANSIDRFHYNKTEDLYERVSQLLYGTWANEVRSIAVDQSDTSISLLARSLDTGNWTIMRFANRSEEGVPLVPTTLDLSSIPNLVTPTGLAINRQTGDYLVINSSVSNSAITLYIIDGITGEAKTEEPIRIHIGSPYLSVPAVGETNFKIAYNDQENILYLMTPNIGYIYGLSLPQYLSSLQPPN